MVSELFIALSKNKTHDPRPLVLSGLIVLSGLFQFALGNEYFPFLVFFGDVLPSMDSEADALWFNPHDTSSFMHVANSFSYDDFYHAKALDLNQIVESERLAGSAVLKRRTWALMPWWNVKKGFVCSSSADDSYQYKGALSSEKAGVSGWLSRGPFMAAYSCGWDFDNTIEPRFGYVLKNFAHSGLIGKLYDLHGDYSLTLGAASGNVFGAIYVDKSLLPLAGASVANKDDGARVPFGFAAVAGTIGARLSVSRRFVDACIDAGYSTITSDSAAIVGTAIPVTVDAGVYHGNGAIRLPQINFQPRLEMSVAYGAPKLRGFDGPGGPMFFYLDKNSLDIESAAISGNFWRKIRAGLTAEHCSFSNDIAGRLDPYLFSSMFVFMPNKYKIDYADFAYSSYGMYAQRTQQIVGHWDLDAFVSVSRILARAVVDAREFDFTEFFGIPVLRNPTHTELLNDDILLIMVSLNSAFTYRDIALHADVQQAFPIDLRRHGNGGGNSQSNGTAPVRSVRGGTRYNISMEFLPK
jgi:hypothetical protein